MIRGILSAVTPSDSAVVEGSMLLITGAGNLVLKGTQPSATALPAMAVTVGQQLYIPGACVVMAAGTTATVAVMG